MEKQKSTGAVYLDHAGAALPLPEQLEAVFGELSSTLYSNPHSRSPSSKMTTDSIDQARYRVLEHFATTEDHYSCIFTASCTAALKLLAESINWDLQCEYCLQHGARTPRSMQATYVLDEENLPKTGPCFAYLMDNHTSVMGMREYALSAGVPVFCVRPDQVEDFIAYQEMHPLENTCQCVRLFVCPGQSNFCGRKYDWASYAKRLKAANPRWLFCVDAAALASTNPCNLPMCQVDFFTISFYKIFGYPTGLGALLIRKEIFSRPDLLKKRYFGGGTVQVAFNNQNFVKYRESVAERFEDGTVAYQQILALKHGFQSLKNKGGMEAISKHVFSLAAYVYKCLTTLKHANGAPIATVYCHGHFENPNTQGGIVNFNLIRSNGDYVGYAEAEKMAELYDIHWRTGYFCNLGACQLYLGLTEEQLMYNYESGKVCGDTIDLIDGRPVGSIRVSFGWTSKFSDAEHLIRMIWECFVDKGPMRKSLPENLAEVALTPYQFRPGTEGPAKEITHFHAHNGVETEEFFEASDCLEPCVSIDGTLDKTSSTVLTDIYVFPVKSCAAGRVSSWRISEKGLAYDRCWMITTADGLCLTQKREPKLCLIRPRIDSKRSTLTLQAHEHPDLVLHLHSYMVNTFSSDTAIAGPYCQSKVCADRVSTSDCGSAAGQWVDDVVDRNGCKLVVQTDDLPRKGLRDSSVSLANEEQYLLLHRASTRNLLALIHITSPEMTEDELILRFRPNLVIGDGAPLEEESWSSVSIGGVEFQCVGKCTRCQMICVDQNTGETDKNVLLALREFRDNKTTFGIYLQAHPNSVGKSIQVGDAVKVIKYSS